MTLFDISSVDTLLFCRAIGLVGFSLYVCAFFALSVGRLTSTQPLYFVLCLTAASCVLISLWADFNLSSALIQGFYIFMSMGAIFLRLKQRRKAQERPASV